MMVAAKAVASLVVSKAWMKTALYAVILACAGLGAWFAGNDVAAEVYMWSSGSNLVRGDLYRPDADEARSLLLRMREATERAGFDLGIGSRREPGIGRDDACRGAGPRRLRRRVRRGAEIPRAAIGDIDRLSAD